VPLDHAQTALAFLAQGLNEEVGTLSGGIVELQAAPAVLFPEINVVVKFADAKSTFRRSSDAVPELSLPDHR
jgi:hypothetical protein